MRTCEGSSSAMFYIPLVMLDIKYKDHEQFQNSTAIVLPSSENLQCLVKMFTYHSSVSFSYSNMADGLHSVQQY